jgi:hypothetical protein
MEEIVFKIILPLAFIVAIWFVSHYQRLYNKYKGMYELSKSDKYREIFDELLVKGIAMTNEKLNIHERRDAEKRKLNICRSCGSAIVKWSSDSIQNCYLSCKCSKCGKWNEYKYWP